MRNGKELGRSARLAGAFGLTVSASFLLLVGGTAHAQSTTSGLSLKKVCPSHAVTGETVTCTLQVENQSLTNSVTALQVTNQFPFPGGAVSVVGGCNTSLTPSDGTSGAGPDYTECTVMEILDQECLGLSIVVIDQATASGTDSGTGSVMNTATNAVIVSCGSEVVPPESVPMASSAGLAFLVLGLVGFGASRIARRG